MCSSHSVVTKEPLLPLRPLVTIELNNVLSLLLPIDVRCLLGLSVFLRSFCSGMTLSGFRSSLKSLLSPSDN